MLGLIVAFVVGAVAGFLGCVWFGPKNKKTYAKIREEMARVFDDIEEATDDVKAKVQGALDEKFGDKK